MNGLAVLYAKTDFFTENTTHVRHENDQRMQQPTGQIDVSQYTVARHHIQKLLSKFHAQPVF